MVPTSHISDIVAPHIPYPTLFVSLTCHIQKIWTKTSQIQQKLCSLCILFVLNHDIAHSVVNSTIFAGRIEFSSDGKGIDNFFVLIIYMFQESRIFFFRSPPPQCVWPGGGGAYYVTSHQAWNHIHQAPGNPIFTFHARTSLCISICRRLPASANLHPGLYCSTMCPSGQTHFSPQYPLQTSRTSS